MNSLLIKPSGADCNLHCRYCFYLGSMKSSIHQPRMTEKTLERLIQSYMNTTQPIYSFAWQGGEPTLMGLDFFRKVVHYHQFYGKPGPLISNSMQTNGTLITEEWAQFLRQYNFLVGVSLDGPGYIAVPCKNC